VGLYSHYDGAHNHPVNRALHLIAIPLGFSSVIVVWFHWIIGLLLIPAAFALATGLAGLTGALVTPILSLAPHIGDPVLATSFLIVILGGLGSVGGATVAAFVVGMVEAFSAVYLGGSKGALALFVLVLITLVIRPSGLFGHRVRGA